MMAFFFSPPEKHIIGACEGLNGEYELNHNGKENASCIQFSDEGFLCSSDSEADHCSITKPLGNANAMIVENIWQVPYMFLLASNYWLLFFLNT